MWCRAWLYNSFCMNMDSQDYDLILAVEGKIVLMILNSSFQRNSIYQNDVVAVEIPEKMSQYSTDHFNKFKLLQLCSLQLLLVYLPLSIVCLCLCNGCVWICVYVCVCVCVCVVYMYFMCVYEIFSSHIDKFSLFYKCSNQLYHSYKVFLN